MINILYRSRTIKYSDTLGMILLDDRSNEHLIDFNTCADNWYFYVQKNIRADITRDQLGTSRCVAITKQSNKKYLITFLSDPNVSVEFSFSIYTLRPALQFNQMKNLIRILGWRTYDGS